MVGAVVTQSARSRGQLRIVSKENGGVLGASLTRVAAMWPSLRGPRNAELARRQVCLAELARPPSCELASLYPATLTVLRACELPACGGLLELDGSISNLLKPAK